MNGTFKGFSALAALAAAAAGLAACQQKPPPGFDAIPLPPQQVEKGSTFDVLAPLTFPPGHSELLFQNQQIVAAGKPAPGMPFCRLKPQLGVAGTLGPGTLTVENVGYGEKEVGATGAMVSVTRIVLAPAKPDQPRFALSCGWPEGAPFPTFVTTQQIYDAIGGQFSMNLVR